MRIERQGRRVTRNLDLFRGHLILPCDLFPKELPHHVLKQAFENSNTIYATINHNDNHNDEWDDHNDNTNTGSINKNANKTETVLQQTNTVAERRSGDPSLHPMGQRDLVTTTSTATSSSNSNIARRRSGDPSPHLSGQGDLAMQQSTEHYNIATDNDDDNNDNENEEDNYHHHNQTRSSKRTRTKTKQVKSLLHHTQQQLMSTYIRNKYAGLPAHTPPPDISQWLHGPRWTLWEFWAGSGRLSRTMGKYKLADGTQATAGPPVSWEFGWDLRNPTHTDALKVLYRNRQPFVVFAAPSCGPWSSSSTNLDAETKNAIREVELKALNFYLEIAQLQSAKGRSHILEQSQASELLRTSHTLQLLNFDNSIPDQLTHQCFHGACDAETGEPIKKPTVFRGTVPLPNTAKLCV
jgi:hypothetical protein